MIHIYLSESTCLVEKNTASSLVAKSVQYEELCQNTSTAKLWAHSGLY
jgi:hypothetical protein